MARLFGPTQLGYYQLAYNLAELPNNQVGDHVGDVLLPAFARLPRERRGPALARALRLLGLVMFPLSIGLGVMGPTLVAAFLGIVVACDLEKISPVPLLRGLRGPLLACLPMVGAVLGVRFLMRLAGVGSPYPYVVVELLVGAAAYVGAALLLAPVVARELFMVLRTTLLDRKPREPRSTATLQPQPRAAS